MYDFDIQNLLRNSPKLVMGKGRVFIFGCIVKVFVRMSEIVNWVS